MTLFLTQAGYRFDEATGTWRKPGQTDIAYNDGDAAERELAAVISATQDVSVLSTQLKAHIKDWHTLYHLGSARANILRPFAAQLAGCDVLEIGAGCGAITRFLGETGATVLAVDGTARRATIARSRTRDLPNVTVVVENFSDFEVERKFDVVTLIGVLEYAHVFSDSPDAAVEMLRRVRSFLRPGGRLFIAIENQLGLKYLAGANEDHVGVPGYGVEGRYAAGQPRTWGRQQLQGLLAQAGFPAQDFLAPFPDYKLPVSIVTEAGWATPGFDAGTLASQSSRRDPQLPAYLCFAPERVWPEVARNGIALDLANSFLVVARPEPGTGVAPEVLAYHYSTERAPAYCKETRFVRDDDRQVDVRYARLHESAPPASDGARIQFTLAERSDYVRGQTLAIEFARCVTRDGWTVEDVGAFLRKYLALVARLSGAASPEAHPITTATQFPGSAFDLLPQNIIATPEGAHAVIDQEWSLAQPVSAGWLTFRALHSLANSLTRFGLPASTFPLTREGFFLAAFAAAGLSASRSELDAYNAQEASIQSLVTGMPAAKFASWFAEVALPISDMTRAIADRDQAVLALRGQLAQAAVDLAASQAAIDQLLRSRSWQMTKPVRFAGRLMRHGLSEADRAQLVARLKAIYRRLPLPAPARRGLRAGYRAASSVLRLARGPKEHRFELPAFMPAPRSEGASDYIIWGVIDWHFRQQRPQHLARSIASRGRRVFYISSDLLDRPSPGFSVERLDESGRLFQVRLHADGALPIYDKAPDEAVVAALRRSIGELLDWANARSIVSLVQHSYWHGVASVLPDSRLVYDCMDHHEGFGNNDETILALERTLLAEADQTIATSAWLADILKPQTARCAIVRNAGDFEHFSKAPATLFRDPEGRRVIGYVGAIAEWFDVELVEKIARRFSDCAIVLVGNDSVNAKARLRHCPNVSFTGEVPYADLPFYVHAFQVCLLPFKVIPLTLATNPVKVYEYLSAGKPVVGTALPEMQQFGDLVWTAAEHAPFLDAVGQALSQSPEQGREARQAFAREQTWAARAQSVIAVAEASVPAALASVIVVTYNNLELTKACLASLDAYTGYEALEIIVVDNASSDGTPDYLREWARSGEGRQIVLNDDNRGFAAANNQGLAIARGDYLVLLNNDTHVTPGWLPTMIRHLRGDASIGLLGPVTNNIGNEARIDIKYDDMPEMMARAAAYTRRHIGRTFEIRTAAFFCVAMRRDVYTRVGPLDEAFGRGFFEDDDYCRRVEKIGLRVCCAEDVFIHHHLSASFNKLKQAERQTLFEQNKQVYEAKWGPWKPHVYRAPAAQAEGRRDAPALRKVGH
jgi:GT2 family glycosyltransferase/glycosyltransferase involved in cell wall biosynthesis/2-polyprenyl-3-methyl-5-hydroxy-6-metoxy-1,4-benzoquinol methylase